MATQLAETEQRVPAKSAVAAGGKLAAFVPQTLDEAWRLSGALAQSGMTPKAYGSDQNKIMVGIMAGAEVGLTPFAALQSIAVIGNNPSLWGDGALALVQASGLLDDMEETDDGSAATCRLNRKGRATPIVRKFSMDDAKKAGLAGKSGPWSQYPARMRQMRARAFALRDGFSDVLKGLHIAEEVRDYSPMGGNVVDLTAAPLSGQMLIEQAKPAEEAEPDQAAQWVVDHIEVVETATDGEELDLTISGGSRAMKRLEAERPELHAKVIAAYATRRAELDASKIDPTIPDSSITDAHEGRADEQHGERFSDDMSGGGF